MPQYPARPLRVALLLTCVLVATSGCRWVDDDDGDGSATGNRPSGPVEGGAHATLVSGGQQSDAAGIYTNHVVTGEPTPAATSSGGTFTVRHGFFPSMPLVPTNIQ